MNPVRHFFVATCLLAAGLWAGEHNTLSKTEKAAGWQLLFDGKNINTHWRNIGQKEVTGTGWVIKEGVLIKEEGKAAKRFTVNFFSTDGQYDKERAAAKQPKKKMRPNPLDKARARAARS